MKRGKDEEKILEPMFPRLHVNDAEKGGPRAPPRNKMALYEQLSIPSQRFRDPGTLPRNSLTNTNTVVPPGPSSQPCGVERHLYAQHQMPYSATVHATENFVSQRSFMENVRSMAQHNEKKMIREEDDFAVPVFVNSRKSQCYGRIKSGTEKEKDSVLMAPISHHSLEIQEVNHNNTKQNGCLAAFLKPEIGNQGLGNTNPGGIVNSLNLSATKEMDVEKSTSSCDRANDCNASAGQDYQNRLNQDDSDSRVKDTVNGVESHLAMESHSDDGCGSPDDIGNVCEYRRSREFISLEQGNEEASDGLSDETSMVDSISSIDLSPDDVVGVLGQKRFWRARKAIANQQRVFAVQLFELHRLIKVQKLIAASPNLLLDDVNYIAKSPAKRSPMKKLLPLEFLVKPLPDAGRLRGDSEKTDQHTMECSAENVIWKLPSVSPSITNQGHHQPSNYIPFLGNPPASSVGNGEAQMTSTGGWCFPPQPPLGNQQWLIPVMSPSEGLIYKPHPALGQTGPVCRGYYGQFMPAPMVVSNFMGGQAAQPPYHPGVGFPSPGHGYFPPYGLPTMNPHSSGQHQPNEQMNQFGHTGDLQSAALNIQQQSSCNIPRNSDTAQQQHLQGAGLPATKSCSRTRKSSHPQQGSNGSRVAAEGSSGNSFRPFPAVNEENNNNNNASKQTLTTTTTTTRTTVTQTTRDGGAGAVTRVIKVVPHNAKVASENAARIFQSIQEERKHYDSFSNT